MKSNLLLLFFAFLSFNSSSAQCGAADLCSDVTEVHTLYPVTPDSFAFDYTCMSSCLDEATPEMDTLVCGFNEYPTVWFKVESDGLGAQLFVTVETNGMWDPLWAVYASADNDCENLEIVSSSGSNGMFPCSNDDETPGIHQSLIYNDVPVYYIAVSIDPENLLDEDILDKTFDVCVASVANTIVCLGEMEASGQDASLNIEVLKRSCGGDLNGPFYPGEEIIVDLEFFYDASESGADWLSGIVPSFGKGWDLTGFYENSEYYPYGNGQQSSFHAFEGDCAPILQEDLSHMCTYYDEEGIFRLCNALDENCPCELGMVEGDPLPSGWFWVTNGGNAGCDNDCSPGEGWGIGSVNALIEQTMVLKVKDFDSVSECFDNKDLQISFQTFSDGVSGCWEDPVGECLVDRKQFGPKWEVDCGSLDMVCDFYKVVHDVFFDINENGIHDEFEPDYREGAILVDPDGDYYYDTEFGLQNILLTTGTYDISFFEESAPGWNVTTDSLYNITLDVDNECDTVSFGLYPENPMMDLQSTLILPFPRCNDSSYFSARAKNNGHFIEDGTLWVTIDENVDIVFDQSPDSIISPNVYGWHFADLNPGNSFHISGIADIPGPPDFPIGDEIFFYSQIESLDSLGMTDYVGQDTLIEEVLCSYDPNDKLVSPGNDQGHTYIGTERLVYTVRFQNTGNAEALDIVIRDTLSEYVIPSSFKYIASSHAEKLEIKRSQDNILAFTFENILLPDSTTSPELSKGFITFSVNIKDGLEEGVTIENTGHIYFDNNPAIVTNTARSILYDDVDNDGALSIVDCDDLDASINPDAMEIPNNDVDEDCDGVALIIDDDNDGFNSDEDCDDNDPNINPDQEEIINNSIDEDCDGLAVIIDNDNDGFNSDEDCDDDNAEINPDAIEIPDNDIDENCDGEDDVTISTVDINPFGASIYPNPASYEVYINVNYSSSLTTALYDINGREVIKNQYDKLSMNISHLSNGIYYISIQDEVTGQKSLHKIVKI